MELTSDDLINWRQTVTAAVDLLIPISLLLEALVHVFTEMVHFLVHSGRRFGLQSAKKISRISRQTDFWKIRENLFSRISRETDFLKISRKQNFANFAIFFQIREIREN